MIGDAGIIRNRLRIQAAIVNGKPLQNDWEQANQVPTTTLISDAMAADLKKQRFKFTGSTICYAFMQASGMVNDHTMNCFCYRKKPSVNDV